MSRNQVFSLLSKSPLTSASPLQPMPSVMHRSRRSCRASCGLRPRRQPEELSCKSCSSIASTSLATARWTIVSANVGCPIGRWPPSAFSHHPRSTGGAWERPRRRRSCRSRRFASRCAAYGCAVTPSIPAALDLLVWRYAARRTSSSLRWANVVHTRWASWAACSAMGWSVVVTVGDRTVSPGFPSTTT